VKQVPVLAAGADVSSMLLYGVASSVQLLLSLLLQGRRLIALDMGALIAGAKYRGIHRVYTTTYITLKLLYY
jgi:hypothetical protein